LHAVKPTYRPAKVATYWMSKFTANAETINTAKPHSFSNSFFSTILMNFRYLISKGGAHASTVFLPF